MHSFQNFIVRLIPNHPPPLETRVWKLVVRALTQSSVNLRSEHHLVEVVICTSLTMPTPTKTRIVTLATHTNHHLGISTALHRPGHCLLIATNSHQQKLKYFTE